MMLTPVALILGALMAAPEPKAMLLRIERLLLELTGSREGGPREVDHP